MELSEQLMNVVGFDLLYGQTLLELGAERAVSEVTVGPQHLQPTGLVHGGVYAAIAESIASLGTNVHTLNHGRVGVGLSNHTSFLRPIKDGKIHAVATRQHAGRTTWVWEVQMRDDQERLAAISRVTVAVRDVDGASSTATTPPEV